MKPIFCLAVGLFVITSSTGCSWLFCHHRHRGDDCCDQRCDKHHDHHDSDDDDDCDKHHHRGHDCCGRGYPGYYQNPCCQRGCYSSNPYTNYPYYPYSANYYGYPGTQYQGDDDCGCGCGNYGLRSTEPLSAPMPMMEQGPTPAMPPQQALPPMGPGSGPSIAPVPNPVPTPGTAPAPAPGTNGPAANSTSGIPTVRAGLYGGPVQYNQLNNQQVYDVSRGQWVQLQ